MARKVRCRSLEVIMNPHNLRRVPWTCEWGRFGVAIEQTTATESRVDDVFWACHNPARSTEVQTVRRGECEACPHWVAASRLE
jgi:hypothetical protein